MAARHTEQDYSTVGKDHGIEWIGDALPPNARTKTKWRCSKGHPWNTDYNKIQQRGRCPTCSKERRGDRLRFGEGYYRRIGIGRNIKWIGSAAPANMRTPTKWQCTICDYEWDASGDNVSRGTGCAKCAGKAPLTEQDYIDLAAKRGIVWIGSDLPKTNATKTEWRCGEGHEWPASHANIQFSKSSGCPFCAGKRVSITTSLENLHPETASQWHPTKNGSLTPKDVTAGSNQKVWWKCPEGPDHEWSARIAKRTGSGRGCPFCAGQRVSITNSLASSYPEIASEWHPTKNGDLTPDKVVAGIPKKVWWKCPEGHEWKTTLANRTKGGTGCPSCAEFGFDPTIPAIAYYVRIETDGGPVYKIGVTNRTVAERFSLDIDRIKLIMEWEFNAGIEALEFERKILTSFQAQRYDGPPILTRGNTEIFEVDVLDLDE